MPHGDFAFVFLWASEEADLCLDTTPALAVELVLFNVNSRCGIMHIAITLRWWNLWLTRACILNARVG